MARIARVVVPDIPHHITQHGNRRQRVFFFDGDYEAYINLMSEWCKKYKVEIWAYCLMPNHVHLIATPATKEGLHKVIGEAHRRYTRMINFRKKWRGYLWQGRFASFPMDDIYMFRAARYIEMNPVRAGIVDYPEEYPWSSAKAHLSGKDDSLVKVAPILEKSIDWGTYLNEKESKDFKQRYEKHQRTGRPLGDGSFVERLGKITFRDLRLKKPGRKPKRKRH
jgi:putative transposase